MGYEALNILDPQVRPPWEAAGSPTVPVLVIEGQWRRISHPLQAAALLGLEPPPAAAPLRVAWRTTAAIELWVTLLGTVPETEVLRYPSGLELPLRNRAISVLGALSLLPETWRSRRYAWPGDPDTGEHGEDALIAWHARLDERLGRAGAVRAWAEQVELEWAGFLVAVEEDLTDDPMIATQTGPLAFSRVLEWVVARCRTHAAQTMTLLERAGHRCPWDLLRAIDGGASHGQRQPSDDAEGER